jgi:hypothetical protein
VGLSYQNCAVFLLFAQPDVEHFIFKRYLIILSPYVLIM